MKPWVWVLLFSIANASSGIHVPYHSNGSSALSVLSVGSSQSSDRRKAERHDEKEISEQDVARAIITASKKYGIAIKDLFALISIESDFRPLVLTVETDPKRAGILEELRGLGLKIVKGGRTFHSKRQIVDIYPPDIQTGVLIARALKEFGFTFDIGIMQINSCNFTLDEVNRLFDPLYNISKGAKIYKGCIRRYKNKTHQVECYNRGAGNLNRSLKKGRNYFPYWKRFKMKYYRYFK